MPTELVRSQLRSLLFAFAAFVLLATAAPLAAQLGDAGLWAVRAQRFGRAALPHAHTAGRGASASSVAVGDFDGDGAADLATGAPFSDGPSATPLDECGQVVVRYGVPGRGVDAQTAPQVIAQFVAGSTNAAEVGDHFGAALVACN